MSSFRNVMHIMVAYTIEAGLSTGFHGPATERTPSIGSIHSPFKNPAGMPIQPKGAQGIEGTIVMNPAFAAGLQDLEGFSHIILLYHFHCSRGPLLKVTPFLDSHTRGIFATRAPRRPNPIGLSIVRLSSIAGTHLVIKDVDILDGTPLLDIKPYVPEFDHRDVENIGWLAETAPNASQVKADERFK